MRGAKAVGKLVRAGERMAVQKGAGALPCVLWRPRWTWMGPMLRGVGSRRGQFPPSRPPPGPQRVSGYRAPSHGFCYVCRQTNVTMETNGHPEQPTQDASVRSQTYGEKAVGLSFNPSGDDAVATCKAGFAKLIDQMFDLRANATDPEAKRLASVAITEAQTAQMWAVKALTWKP